MFDLICYLKSQRRQALFARDNKISYSVITRKLNMFFCCSLNRSRHLLTPDSEINNRENNWENNIFFFSWLIMKQFVSQELISGEKLSFR